MDWLIIAFVLFVVVVLFNIIIIVHELGHFLAAKWRGLYVDRFGIWFGKPLWKKKINGVTYSLGTIPAGGFVSVPQLAPMEMLEGKIELEGIDLKDLPRAKPIDKIIVAAAGPLFSLLLAFAFAIIVWQVGKPVNMADTSTEIGYVLPDSPAEQAGLQVGDVIQTVNGHEVENFMGSTPASIIWNIITAESNTIRFVVERNGEMVPITVEAKIPETGALERPGFRQVGIQPPNSIVISEVNMNYSPAQVAGLRVGDQILAIDGVPMRSNAQLTDYIQAHADQEMVFTVLRDGEEMQFSITPETPKQGLEDPRPLIGIGWNPLRWDAFSYPNPFEQVKDSALMVYNTLKALFNSKTNIGPQHLSGPVGIINAYRVFLSIDQGWRLALWFSVVLNVNLAILNMLPFPVLDGGHITLAAIEGVRRKPVNMRFLEIIQTGCALVLIFFMLFVSFYDVQDVATGVQAETAADPPEIIFSEKPGVTRGEYPAE